MDVQGLGLLRAIIEATGLPGDSVEKEIERIAHAQGLSTDALTMDQVRDLLATYLQEVFVEAKANY